MERRTFAETCCVKSMVLVDVEVLGYAGFHVYPRKKRRWDIDSLIILRNWMSLTRMEVQKLRIEGHLSM